MENVHNDRPQRTRVVPSRLEDCEIIVDSEVTEYTWKLVKLPAEKKAIEVKWVYKPKHNPDGSIAKLKGRLVAT